MRFVGFALTLVGLLAGPVAAQQPGGPSAWHWLNGRTIVFVADGAGDSAVMSDSLRAAVEDCRVRVAVQRVPWCQHGHITLDYFDTPAQYTAAARLAQQICWLNRECPHCRIVLVGHSGGTIVMLMAAGMLPPGSVDRIILAGTPVSTCYDLRPALQASKGGIDSFYSVEDGVLAWAEASLGTPDGRWGMMAGRVGFRAPGDPTACANLRQYRWCDGMCGDGGHFYWTREHFLRTVVVPMLLR